MLTGVTRQKILITGASSGLGAGMARSFAAQGRDLALCARRTDRLTELKAELSQRYPDIKIAVAELDVNDHERVPKVFAELSDEIGGIDRVIVNAGIGKGARLGSGKLWANKATIETNLVAALVQIETALDMFNQRGSGHLVLISSVLGVKGVPGVKAAYAASKAGVRSLGESLRAEYAQRLHQGHGAGAGLYRVGDDGQIGEHNVDGGQRNWRQGAGGRHRARARTRRGPLVAMGATGAADVGAAAAADQTLRLAGARPPSPRGHVRCGSGAPARRSSCPTAVAVNRRR